MISPSGLSLWACPRTRPPRSKRAEQSGILDDLLAVLLSAYDDKGTIGDRIRVSVPDLLVGEGSVTTLALVIHELATNSLKYGALSKAAARWMWHAGQTAARQSSSGRKKAVLPLSLPRGRPGFGSKLVHQSITSQLGGQSHLTGGPRE